MSQASTAPLARGRFPHVTSVHRASLARGRFPHVTSVHRASLARGQFPRVTSVHRASLACGRFPPVTAVSPCHERPPRQSRSRAVSAGHERRRASLARGRFPHVPPRQSRSRAVSACHERPPRQSRSWAKPHVTIFRSRAVSACHERASLSRSRVSLAHPVCTTPPSHQPAPHRRPPSQPRTPGLHPQPASHARSAAQRNGNPFLSPSSQLVSLPCTLRENLKQNPSIRDAFGGKIGLCSDVRAPFCLVECSQHIHVNVLPGCFQISRANPKRPQTLKRGFVLETHWRHLLGSGVRQNK